LLKKKGGKDPKSKREKKEDTNLEKNRLVPFRLERKEEQGSLASKNRGEDVTPSCGVNKKKRVGTGKNNILY